MRILVFLLSTIIVIAASSVIFLPIAITSAQPNAQPNNFAAQQTQTDCCAAFHRQLQEYANPAICPMVLCHGGCRGCANACGSLSGSTVLDSKYPGHFISERNCRAARN